MKPRKIYPKQITRWLRALELAQILFEAEGYHRDYLTQIDEFIRRKTMYSPKITDDLIPGLYQAAKAKRIPMTRLVDKIVREYLTTQADKPLGNHKPLASVLARFDPKL